MTGNPRKPGYVLASTTYVSASRGAPYYSRPAPHAVIAPPFHGRGAWSNADDYLRRVSKAGILPRSVAIDNRAGIPLYGPGISRAAKKRTRSSTGDTSVLSLWSIERGAKRRKVGGLGGQ